MYKRIFLHERKKFISGGFSSSKHLFHTFRPPLFLKCGGTKGSQPIILPFDYKVRPACALQNFSL